MACQEVVHLWRRHGPAALALSGFTAEACQKSGYADPN